MSSHEDASSTGEYISMSRLRIDPARSDELVAAFRNRVHLVDDADGFRGLQVWRSNTDEGQLIMVSRWRSRESFSAYMSSPEHATSHGRIDPSLQAAIKLERLEHLTTWDVVAT